MIIPVRCFTCGNVIADRWEEFSNRVKAGEHPKEIMDELGISRYCCRRMFISHVDVIDDILKYYEATARKSHNA
ncbi:DNA-directed RNA polymerase subunit N [[Eubacterium] cellulosolvens]